MLKLSETEAEARLKVFTPEPKTMQAALNGVVSQKEVMDYTMDGYTEQQIEEILLEKIYTTVINMEFPLVETERTDKLVKENGQWKVDRNLTSVFQY